MPSRRKLAPVVGKDGITAGSSAREELSTVELDTTFGRLLGIAEGQKVCCFPPAMSAPNSLGWVVHPSRPPDCAYH